MANASTADLSVTNSTANIIDVDTAESNSCWYRRCSHSIKFFTCILAFLACINGGIAAAYLPAIITTIEQRFEIDSSTSGLIVGSYEIGATIAVVFVSYLGHHAHIPLIIGWGTFLIAVGSAIFSIPHFISDVYSEILLYGNREHNSTSIINETFFCALDLEAEVAPAKCIPRFFSGNQRYIAIFIVAQQLIGIGSSPIITIGLTYIDNFVSRKSSAQYLAIVYAASILGAVVGFGLGSGMLQLYVDFFYTDYSPSTLRISPDDDTWIGAWWAGFLLFAVLTLIIAPFLCIFPKSMATDRSPTYSEKYDTTSSEDSDGADANPSAGLASGKLSELPQSLMLLIKNPVYMLLNFGSICMMMIITGFVTFAPKYFETLFYVSKSNASLITGGVAVPAAVLGIVLMGFVLKKFKIGEMGAMNSILILNIVAICGLGASFSLGCPNRAIAGVTAPYFNNETLVIGKTDLTSSCNQYCNCDDNVYQPVCHIAGDLTYLSPCHAGCSSDTTDQLDQCSCVVANQPLLDSVTNTTVQNDSCKGGCKLMGVYLAVLAVISCAMAGVKTPVAIITLRCVSDELKSFGLGIQVMIIRLLALLPAPIIYGAIIDSSCMLWKTECGKKLNCLVYNNIDFLYKFQGFSLGFQLLGTVMFFIAWVIMRRDHAKELSSTYTSDEYETKVTRL